MAGAIPATLGLPASAPAATLSWSQPPDFTTRAPGANPERKYGHASWSYSSSPALTQFSANFHGGLAGWADNTSIPTTFVAVNGSGQLEMLPARSQSVTLGWAAPFTRATTASVTGTISQLGSGLACGFSWRLANGGSVVASGTNAGTINSSPRLSPGGGLTLTISDASLLYGDGSCETAVVNLQIQATVTPPHVTLRSLGNRPLHTATPRLKGTASTAPGDSGFVTVGIYSGASATGSPLRFPGGSVDAGGGYSVQIAPALPDGRYTAVAYQGGDGTVGSSAPVTFRIKVHPPAVTLQVPVAGSRTNDSRPQFSGAAGNTLGDSSQVTVVLYKGRHKHGKPLGKLRVTRTGGSWSGRWQHQLRPGRYTAFARQSDDAGHTSVSGSHTFQVIPPLKTIGSPVRLAKGVVSVPITCLAPSGQSCTGNVLILTVRSYRPVAGGPAGPLRLMFAYVTIPAGNTLVVKQTCSPEVVRALRHARNVKVRVTTMLSISGAPANTVSEVRLLKIGA